MAAPMLALESGERKSDPNLAAFGPLTVAVSLLVAFGALLGAWLSLRSGTAVWPPKGVTIENYFGTTLSITMLLAAAAAGWMVYAVKRSERTQVLAAAGMLLLFGLAFLNLLSYVAHAEHFGPATHPYGAVYFAFTILMGVTVVIALVTTLVAAARFLGGQVSAREPALAWSTAWMWWTALAGWLVVYAAVYVVK